MFVAGLSVAACTGSSNTSSSAPPVSSPIAQASGAFTTGAAPDRRKQRRRARRNNQFAQIKHIVIVIQENRSVNNLFNAATGATASGTSTTGYDSNGHQVTLVARNLATSCDPHHDYGNSFRNDAAYDLSSETFKNNGWDLEAVTCNAGNPPPDFAYSYVKSDDNALYRDLAAHFALADMAFQPNMGPSHPAHQYLIAGQSGGYAVPAGATFPPFGETENPVKGYPPGKGGLYTTAGCETTTFTYRVDVMDMVGQSYPNAAENPANAYVPCQDYRTIFRCDRRRNASESDVEVLHADRGSHLERADRRLAPFQHCARHEDHRGSQRGN